jgi:hypothetical protein
MCGGSSSEPYLKRYDKILGHIAKYTYPSLTDGERNAIRVIAESLYDNIKGEAEKALTMYRKLDSAFVPKSNSETDPRTAPTDVDRPCAICGKL